MTRSLSTRVTVAITGVAALVALVAGVLVAPLLDDAARDTLRDSLDRQADLLSRLPASVLASPAGERIADRSDLVIGAVGRDGSRSGAATLLTDAEVERLLDGAEVSTDGRLGGRDVLVEARPTRDGGAAVVAGDVTASPGSLAQLRRRVLTAIVLGLLVAVVVGSVLANRIGRPLRQTADAARRMAEGERGVGLPRPATSEVADVSEALGTLDRALATSEDRQRQFLLSVSHELRTPLTTLRGYAEALADGVISGTETRDAGRTLGAEAARLERYVGDLLALARLGADDFALDRDPADLVDLVRRTAEAWRAQAEARRVSVRPELPDMADVAVVVDTDAARLRQVLDALVDNAVRVCPGGSEVVVAVVAIPGGARLEVRDSGPGLTSEDAAVAFEPGVLHQRYAGVRPGGHGLGLAIVHRLVTRLGGTIRVDRAPEGGAAFVIDLPVDPPR